MKRVALWLVCICCMASAARAEVTVEEERVLQKGLFLRTDCTPDPSEPGYDECKCDGDVRYPEIVGMTNTAAEATLNASFKHAAELAQCEGVAVKEPAKAVSGKEQEKSPASASHHYEVTFRSPSVLGLKFTDWGYSGGAHGNGSVTGVIVDLGKGKILAIGDLFAPKEMAAVNKVIYDALSAKPEEEIFRDQIESRKGAFVSAKECQGCTLTLMPDGVHVVFQTYEVASFAEGNMEVPIPKKYVRYPVVAKALSEQKPTAPEKK